ncbi:MAG: protein kinase, partial [Cyanobacteria bacterium P01_H01_bin.130]
LGEGGFCCTYLAVDNRDRPVAIKTLNAKRCRPQELTKRQQDFANEALWLAKCHHPNIVAIEEMVLDGLRWCMVLEFLPGPDLNALVKREGPLSEARSLGYIQQLGGAIAHMHDFGLLHRDIKPLNVLTRGTNLEEAVLIDFGVARPFRQGEVAFHPDYTTRGFAPLEQYDRQGKRGAFIDVYGLAATLYFLVTGEVPRSPLTRVEYLQKQEPDPLVPPQDYAPELGDRTAMTIQKGLALQSEDRPQTIQDFLEQLGIKLTVKLLKKGKFRRELQGGESSAEMPVSSPQTEYESALGLDFEPLREFLDTNQWRAADQETARLLQEMAGVLHWAMHWPLT